MTVSVGFTVEEIREFVHEYQVQPWGQRRSWLAAQGVSIHRFRRWQATVFEGDLDRGLVPRETGAMTVPPAKRTALEKARAAERAAHAAEVAALRKRISELEGTNDALGKAIGLLHAMNEQEPDDAPQSSDPSTS
jgi:DNA-binding transcriptional MerR regulator